MEYARINGTKGVEVTYILKKDFETILLKGGNEKNSRRHIKIGFVLVYNITAFFLEGIFSSVGCVFSASASFSWFIPCFLYG